MPFNYISRGYCILIVSCILCSSYTIVPNLPYLSNTTTQAGITTSNQYSVEQLVKDIFINGGCKNVFNIKAIGNLQGIGFFDNGTSSISLEKGILLSTGPIKNAEGPNTSRQITGDFGDARGDIDLNIIAEEKVADAVGIEFDFIPLDSTVSFNYVFASEEYCEFVGTKFNDIFGFFISGPGINGPFNNNATNVALIPGTNDFVEINSVNHQKNSAYYVNNLLADDATSCGIRHEDKPTRQLIEFDGFTTVLTSTIDVIPCETYHIRLVVADRGDHFFDSGVFLGANSFTLGGEATIAGVSRDPNQLVYEGCSDGQFLFERVNPESLNEVITVPFKISANSSAVENRDFTALPRSIDIPAGDQSVSLPIEALIDDLPESFDTLFLELDYPCECRTDTAYLIIADPPALQAIIPETFICPGEEIELSPKVLGGNSPFTYEWDNGDTTLNRIVSPAQETRYIFKVKDNCGQEFETSTFVKLLRPAEATLRGEQEFCVGSKAELNVSFGGEAPWSFSITYEDTITQEYTDISQNPFYFQVEKPGKYVLTQFNDNRCKGVPLGEIDIRWSIVDASPEIKAPTCFEKNDGTINLKINSGASPFTYSWSDNPGLNQQNRAVGKGLYQVSITDNNGCTSEFEMEVGAPESLGPVLYDCENPNISLRSLKATGGTPPYLYSVNEINFSTSLLFEKLDPGSLYDLTIKDQQGCLYTQLFQLPTGIRDFVRLQRNIILDLGDKVRLEPELLVPRTLIDSVSWYPEDNLTCPSCLDPILTVVNNDVYRLEVFDIFGCKDTATINVTLIEGIQVYVPTAFSPNGDGINDRFNIFAKNSQIKSVNMFRIYDRWGNLLFERKEFEPGDFSAGWNGRVNGKKVNPGTYIYNLIVELIDGTQTEMNGSVLLMR